MNQPINSREQVLAALDKFHIALEVGQVPASVFVSAGPDYANGRVRLTIYPDSPAFRVAVNRVLGERNVEIVIEDVTHYGGDFTAHP